ncbi:MAG: hypothetical protein ACLFRI_06950 [Candidatus Izemoplasmataceae bacterium]
MKEKIYEKVLQEKTDLLNELKKEEESKKAIEKYHLMLDLGLYETVPLYNEELFDYRNSYTGNDGQRYKLVPLDLSDEELLRVKALDDEIKALKKKDRLHGDYFMTILLRRLSIILISLSVLLSMVLISTHRIFSAIIFFFIALTLNLIVLALSEFLRLQNQKKSD